MKSLLCWVFTTVAISTVVKPIRKPMRLGVVREWANTFCLFLSASYSGLALVLFLISRWSREPFFWGANFGFSSASSLVGTFSVSTWKVNLQQLVCVGVLEYVLTTAESRSIAIVALVRFRWTSATRSEWPPLSPFEGLPDIY